MRNNGNFRVLYFDAQQLDTLQWKPYCYNRPERLSKLVPSVSECYVLLCRPCRYRFRQSLYNKVSEISLEKIIVTIYLTSVFLFIFRKWNVSSGDKFDYYMDFVKKLANTTYENLENMENFINNTNLMNINIIDMILKVMYIFLCVLNKNKFLPRLFKLNIHKNNDSLCY